MIINVEIMKRINETIATGHSIPVSQLVKDCALDEHVLKIVAVDMDRPVVSMNYFFRLIISYLAEMQKRVKMMDECYTAIQKLQIENGIISQAADNKEPAIVWMSEAQES